MTEVVATDTRVLDRDGPSGAVWSLPHGGDLDANAVVLAAGEAMPTHVNDEVDVLYVVLGGSGAIEVDSATVDVEAGWLMFAPKGTARSVRAGESGALVYVTVHRSRAGLAIKLSASKR